MATITLKLDDEQAERFTTAVVTAINDLSQNIAKWQSSQVDATKQGFADLVETFGGIIGDDDQARIDQLTSEIKPEADALESSAQSQT
jgi:hypothetical protein